MKFGTTKAAQVGRRLQVASCLFHRPRIHPINLWPMENWLTKAYGKNCFFLPQKADYKPLLLHLIIRSLNFLPQKRWVSTSDSNKNYQNLGGGGVNIPSFARRLSMLLKPGNCFWHGGPFKDGRFDPPGFVFLIMLLPSFTTLWFIDLKIFL